MKNKQFIYIITAFLFTTSTLWAQKNKIAKADKQFDKLEYMDAVKIYEEVADKGYESQEIFEKLANAYYFNGKLEMASKWFGKLFALGTVSQPEYYFRCAQSLKATGDYAKANEMMTQFSKLVPNDSRALKFTGKEDYLAEIKNNSGRFEVSDAREINTQDSDYGAVYLDHKIVFASSRGNSKLSQKKQSWTGQYFTNLYTAAIKEDGNFDNVELYSKDISSVYNESTPVFTKDGQTVYFTRNNYNEGKRGKDDSQITLLKIYRAQKKDGKWGDIVQLPFCSDKYSTAHPALSPDEKILYFASDMTGTIGMSDIFKVAINPDGTFGLPQNLGKTINTEGRETFPFLTEDNQLYFASTGHMGLGGLDVFVVDLNRNDAEATNIGAPINTPMDDFGFVFNENKVDGLLSSNREGGSGSDDIYKFKKCLTVVKGIVVNQDNNEPIANTTVYISDKMQQPVYKTTTDATGKFEFTANCNDEYFVKAEKENFETNEIAIKTDQASEKQISIGVKNNIVPLVVGTDLAKALNTSYIYFDLGKSDIRKDAEPALEKIVTVLKEHPTLKIDIRSHTDSRASADYNLKLSDKRAQSTRNYLIKHGVAAKRLTAKGYGETQLVNQCGDGVKCTEEEHQQNRRSEFIIVDRL